MANLTVAQDEGGTGQVTVGAATEADTAKPSTAPVNIFSGFMLMSGLLASFILL